MNNFLKNDVVTDLFLSNIDMVTFIFYWDNLLGSLVTKFQWPSNIIHYWEHAWFHVTFSSISNVITLLVLATLCKNEARTSLVTQPMWKFNKQWSWSVVTGVIMPWIVFWYSEEMN